MNPEPPADAVAAQRLRVYRVWLSDPSTRKFFTELERARVDLLTRSARNANKTGLANAKEHNQLVLASSYEKIIQTYGNPDSYPYDILDASERQRLSPNG